jgi:carbon-monoxide dehydrogenase small subunit
MNDHRHRISVVVNGAGHEAEVEPRQSLAGFLREDLGLVGTHIGCEHGVCGTCTVLLGGKSVRSCLMLAVQANGAEITTVEGLARGSEMHPLQDAFWEKQGLQCGYCTPGMLMLAHELLQNDPAPTPEQVRECVAGNLCRCTGYQYIVEAVLAASEQMRGAALGEGQPFEPATER